MTQPAPEEQVRFLSNIQRLLEEGVFVSTYKYALLMTLADLSVTVGDDAGGPLRLTTRQIAARFLEYYWPQARPWIPPAGKGPPGVLRQNTGRRAKVLSLVCEARVSGYGEPGTAGTRAEKGEFLVREVVRVVEKMPLWKLQVVGKEVFPFLYENVGSGHEILLKEGVAFCFRRFYGLVRQLVQGAWLRFVRELKGNRGLLGDSGDLAGFLFGQQRAVLDDFRPLLRAVQSGTCFYCGGTLRGRGEVDHFVPWSRYPLDLGHNFVLACRTCNGGKRDFLACEGHLARWIDRNRGRGAPDLAGYFDSRGIRHDLDNSLRVARWAYTQAETAGARVWVRRGGSGNVLERLGPGWRRLLGA